ncbi:MAG TPA: hypothetical protein VLT61_17630 [Anaeromyxobacteraceae bacterium]|nr:hypothetical protein [Anaeromyxobacteraceae bacterium]
MTRNVEMLLAAARAFGELRDEVVFVGGAIVDLLVTDPAAPRPRFTDDVDVVAEVTTPVEWYALAERLKKLGFREDRREGAPLCRWLAGDLAVDVMPGIEKVLGFANRWYGLARSESDEIGLQDGPAIRVVRAPLFLAMKLEAFASRGGGDFVASHDVEDVIAVGTGGSPSAWRWSSRRRPYSSTSRNGSASGWAILVSSTLCRDTCRATPRARRERSW